MRKIEQQMLAAIRSRKNWKSGNTETVVFAGPEGAVSMVYLHGNHIADVCLQTGGVYVNRETLRNWPTTTTKSRLRALNADLVQRKGVLYLNGEEVARI